MLKGSSFVPEELIQAIESNSNKFKSSSPSNEWKNTPSIILYILVRPFSVKTSRGPRSKELILDANNKVVEITKTEEENKSFEANSIKVKNEKGDDKRLMSEIKNKPKLSNEERVDVAKQELNKVWGELEAITAEMNNRKKKLIEEFTLTKDNLSEAPVNSNSDKLNTERVSKSQSEIMLSNNEIPMSKSKVKHVYKIKRISNTGAKTQRNTKEEIKTTEFIENEIEKRSKENLSRLEAKLKSLDKIKEETFSKLNEYIEKMKTAKDEDGELLIKDADKIDDMAIIIKDYQRETLTDFGKSEITRLIADGNEIRPQSVHNVL